RAGRRLLRRQTANRVARSLWPARASSPHPWCWSRPPGNRPTAMPLVDPQSILDNVVWFASAPRLGFLPFGSAGPKRDSGFTDEKLGCDRKADFLRVVRVMDLVLSVFEAIGRQRQCSIAALQARHPVTEVVLCDMDAHDIFAVACIGHRPPRF